MIPTSAVRPGSGRGRGWTLLAAWWGGSRQGLGDSEPVTRRWRSRWLGSRRCSVLLGWLFLGWQVQPAAAQPDGQVPVRIDYQGPPECPDEAAFLRAIQARTDKVELAEGEVDARVLRVRIRSEASGSSGELTVAEVGGGSGTRRVDGADCREVVQALGLAAALAVDPEAILRTEEVQAEEGESGAVRPKPQSRDPEPARVPPSLPERAPECPVEPQPELRHGWRFEAGVHPLGVQPLMRPGSLGTNLDAFIGTQRREGGAWLRAKYLYWGANSSDGWYRLHAGEASVCPLQVRWGRLGGGSPCALIQGGRLFAEGRASQPRRVTRAWWATGIVARFDLELVPARSNTGFFLEAELGGFVPLVDRRFEVDGRKVGQTATVGPLASLGVGFQF